MIKKVSFSAICMYISIIVANAQTFDISGNINDEAGLPVEFSEIMIFQNDSLVNAKMSDESGFFILSALSGNYKIMIRQFGDTLYFQDIALTQNLDLGVIKVKSATKILQGVEITMQKKLFERKFDRMVFNVASIPNIDGGDVVDILKITPSLIVNNNAIAIAGKGNVNVLINNRFVQLSGEELMNFLKSLRANDVEKIEIITTPPAKYDAEGNSGLINIVLKKTLQETWNGSVFGNYTTTHAKYSGGSLGSSFNYRKERLSLYANAMYYAGESFSYDASTILYPDVKWENRGNYTKNYKSVSARAGFDVEVTKYWTLGAMYIGSLGLPKPESKSESKTSLFHIHDNSDAGLIDTKNLSNGNSRTHSANMHSIFMLDTLGRKINFDFDYLNFNTNANSAYASTTGNSQTAGLPNGFMSQNTLLDRKITNYSTQIDVEHPIEKFNLNYGVKFSFTRTNNDINVFDLSSNIPRNDATQTNNFLYKENIQAIYISGNTFFGEDNNWQLQAGLRGEYTQFEGNSATMDTVFEKSYFQLFPTVHFGYNHNEKNMFYMEYSRRISRPGFDHLNPFRSYSSPYYYFAGNPELKPAFSNNFVLSHVYNNIIQTALFYDYSTDNAGGGVVLLDKDAYTQRGTRLNYFDEYNFGIAVFYTFNKINWWYSQVGANAWHSKINSKIYPLTPKSMESFGGNFQTYNVFYLNKKQTIQAGFDFAYTLPSAAELTYAYQKFALNAFYKMLFFDKKLIVTLNANNLFDTYSFSWKAERSGITTYQKGYYDPMSLRLAVSYSFGSSKVQVRQHEESNKDEKGRL